MITGRVVIAGASGFIGQHLANAFRADGIEVATISRERGDAQWRDPESIRRVIDGSELLINLAGRSVNCRHTMRHKKQILSSRVFTTDALGEAVESVATPPRLWVNASTTTHYAENWEQPVSEETGEIGRGFTSNVAVAWEREFAAHPRDGVRHVAVRMGTVLGADGGALPVFARLARFGLGGAHYGAVVPRGGQWVSWIHIDDVVEAIRFLAEHDEIEGAVNLVAPEPVTDRELMATLRRAVGARVGVPSTRVMLELGAWALRTETELLLRSSRVVPARLLERGFEFRHPTLEGAVADLIRGLPRGHGTID